MLGVLVILIAVLVLAIVLRVSTAAFVVTGLSRDVARFQVRSAFFGVGFTTAEAESVVNHPARRQIAQVLMLLGAIGLTGILGSAVLTFARHDGDVLLPIAALAGGLILLWALTSWTPLDRFLQRRFEHLLRRFTDLDTHDYAALLRLRDDYAVRQLRLEAGGRLDGHSLEELLPRMAGSVVLLGIERADGSYVGAPPLDTRMRAGDIVTIYGHDAVFAALRG